MSCRLLLVRLFKFNVCPTTILKMAEWYSRFLLYHMFLLLFLHQKTNIKIFNKNLGVEAQQICAEMCKKTTFRHFYKIICQKSGIRESYI